MPGRYLLDTNIVIALFADDLDVADKIRDADEVFLPSIVLGELYYGALNSSRSGENVLRVAEFAQASAILPCDATTARLYGNLKTSLRTKGRPIPENDVWVAAVACQFGLILVSRDEHFTAVDQLQVQTW